jgi:hypothetical protein
MHGEPFENIELESAQASGNLIRLEQAKWYLEGCLNVLTGSPEPAREPLTKILRHALEMVRCELRGEASAPDESYCDWQKHRGPDDVRREGDKSRDVDAHCGVRGPEARRKEPY